MSGFGKAREGGVGCNPRLIALTPSPCFLEDRPDFLQIDTREWFG